VFRPAGRWPQPPFSPRWASFSPFQSRHGTIGFSAAQPDEITVCF
jgi:hypothetical protein